MEEPDPRTIRAAAAGDLDAFTDIIRSTQPHVWRFIRHLVGDGETAAELTQETYVKVHRAIGDFRHESLFRTWLLRIARNVAIDELRRTARRAHLRMVELDEAAEAGSRRAGAPPPVGLELELSQALESLPAARREAFTLVEVFGLNYREAAEIIGCPEGTVKSRVFHARAALVAWFQADDRPTGDTGAGEGHRG